MAGTSARGDFQGKKGSIHRARGRAQGQMEGATARTTSFAGRSWYQHLKRAMDLTLSLTALVMLAPLFLVIGLLIKIDSPGPVFFSQERAGFDWRRRRQTTFVMHKFRSMVHNCDQSIHQQLVRDWVRGKKGGHGNGDPSHLVKLTNDSRITRVGRVLRKASLDELPQLWNVLRGEMSLVGPRPVPLYEVEEYESWQRQRLRATPGITGPWQVRGRGLVTVDDMAHLDIEYIEKQSFWLDLKILLQTIPTVLSRRGAV